jgi:MSHA biogenesis protein MshK
MRASVLWAALSFYCALAVAQTMRDPTRPPPGLGGMQASAAVQAPPSGPVLQSVILSPSRQAAIISGRLVERGARYGDAVLVEVTQDRVVLRTDAGTQVLKLYPGTEKRPPGEARDAP